LADESVASSSDGISSSSSRRSTIARRISRRIGDVTGLEMNTAESLQVIRYESLQVTPSPEQFSSIHTGAFIAGFRRTTSHVSPSTADGQLLQTDSAVSRP